ncbi:cytochrome P450, partial [Tanacetum coccineum]
MIAGKETTETLIERAVAEIMRDDRVMKKDPRYWDNPLEFNLERLLTWDGVNQWDYKGNNSKFFLYGSGRRLCLGIPLAKKMQMFILASLLHLFDWSLPKGEEQEFSERFRITLFTKEDKTT